MVKALHTGNLNGMTEEPHTAAVPRTIRVEDQLWDALGTYSAELGTDRATVLRAMARIWVAVARSDPDRALAMVSDTSDLMRKLRRLPGPPGAG